MHMRAKFQWRIGKRSLELGGRTLIMGVVNVTPDSFSDGGQYLDPEAAVEHGLRLLGEGADLIDVGGESTRPGARVQAGAATNAQAANLPPRQMRGSPNIRTFVPEQEELRRILPVVSELKRRRPDAVVSIDTYKAEVARRAVEAGAEIVNDVSGFQWDPEMAPAVARLDCGAILMHVRGRPEEWRKLAPVSDLPELVSRELAERARQAVEAGVERQRIVLDPGLGFGKNYEENYPLLARLEEIGRLGFPLLVGASRKSFVGRAMARGGAMPAPAERLSGSLAAAVIAVLKGAHIIRAHDVKATVEAVAVADAILASG